MQNTFERSVGINDQQRGNFLFFHEAERASREFVSGDGARVGIHGVGCCFVEAVRAVAFEKAAQIAVADDAEQASVFLDGGHPEFFARHLVDDVFHGRSGCDTRDGVAGVHELAHAGEALAQLAAGVERGKIFGLEAFLNRDSDGESVAKREHGSSGGGGREAHATGFTWHAAVERDITGERERGLHVATEADERVADALDIGEKAEDFFRFTAGRERNDDIALGEHAEVAVDGFRRVKKDRGAAGGAECGGNLLCDDAALAHSGDDDAAARLTALENEGDGAFKGRGHGAFEAFRESKQGFCLNTH